MLAIVALIMGLKMSKPRVEDLYTVQEQMETLAAPTPFLADASTVAPTPGNPGGQSVVADPFPKAPADQIEWAVRNGKPSLVLFHSTTCKPCKIMEDLVTKVRADYEPEIVFVDVIVTDRSNTDLIRQARIQAIPTTFFVDVTGQGRGIIGAVTEDKLRAELDRLLNGKG